MTEYVAGFLLDGQNNVALVLKNRPAWQNWQNFATLRGANWTVYFFVAYQEEMPVLCSPTDETIVVRSIQNINPHNSLSNLTWLLPLAKIVLWKQGAAKHFDIKEEY